MNNTLQQLQTLLKQRILILDGAMGTMMQRHQLVTQQVVSAVLLNN